MRVKIFFFLLLVISLAGALIARPVQPWTYKQLLDKADLVVVATVVSTRDTDEHQMLHDVTPAIEVIGVETELESRIVFKGASDTKKFRLHHYRLRDGESFVNGPQLITI